jgi:hypothetical protein
MIHQNFDEPMLLTRNLTVALLKRSCTNTIESSFSGGISIGFEDFGVGSNISRTSPASLI